MLYMQELVVMCTCNATLGRDRWFSVFVCRTCVFIGYCFSSYVSEEKFYKFINYKMAPVIKQKSKKSPKKSDEEVTEKEAVISSQVP